MRAPVLYFNCAFYHSVPAILLLQAVLGGARKHLRGNDDYRRVQPAQYRPELGAYLRPLGLSTHGSRRSRMGNAYCATSHAGLFLYRDGMQNRMASISSVHPAMDDYAARSGAIDSPRNTYRFAVFCGGVSLHGFLRHHRMDQ